MGWKDWPGWERLDRLDYRLGLRRDRSPRERAESLRRMRPVYIVLDIAIIGSLLAEGAWLKALVVFVFGCLTWIASGRTLRRLEREEGL